MFAARLPRFAVILALLVAAPACGEVGLAGTVKNATVDISSVLGTSNSGADGTDTSANPTGSGTGAAAPMPVDGNPRAGGTDGGTAAAPSANSGVKSNALAIYWGQNTTGVEPELSEVCATTHYDIINISFLTSFGSGRSRNKSGLPELNLSNHCGQPMSTDDPYLLSCPNLAKDIVACQQNGKKVILSLGGAIGNYGFSSDDDAKAQADIIFNLFMGGKSTTRPFGTAVLDGVDLDIEGGSPAGYAAFVKALRVRMVADTSKRYFITAAPQCPYPDAYLGPKAGTALGDAPEAFDYLFVQFYNNACAVPRGAPFADSLAQWASLKLGDGSTPGIFVGLPASTQAAASNDFVQSSALPAMAKQIKASKNFAGVMLWDVANDELSKKAYSKSIVDALK